MAGSQRTRHIKRLNTDNGLSVVIFIEKMRVKQMYIQSSLKMILINISNTAFKSQVKMFTANCCNFNR